MLVVLQRHLYTKIIVLCLCSWPKGSIRITSMEKTRGSPRNGRTARYILLSWGAKAILPKWFLPTRLVTRTKESTTYASVRVYKLIREMKVKTRYDSQDAIPTDRRFANGLSKSVIVRTRKMVNYTWVGWSQGKLWWKLVAILTCKSFVKLEYRGETNMLVSTTLVLYTSSWLLGL